VLTYQNLGVPYNLDFNDYLSNCKREGGHITEYNDPRKLGAVSKLQHTKNNQRGKRKDDEWWIRNNKNNNKLKKKFRDVRKKKKKKKKKGPHSRR
jgi:hypothetical protein